MNQTYRPARVSSPGRILGRELEARGWTQKDLAVIMDRPAQTINEIIKGNKQITPETAIELAGAFGTSPEFWNNLESNYRLYLAKKETESDKHQASIARKGLIYGKAPVAEMLKRGWIDPISSIDILETQICQFFGIPEIQVTPKFAVNFRKSDYQSTEIQSQLTWLKRVENLARQQDLPEFDRQVLKDSMPKLLACTMQPEDIALIPPLLMNLGVHFVVVPHLAKTYLDGAAFYLDGQPVVALTLRYNRIDSFWFTLLHELGHIIAGHMGSYLDDLENLASNSQETEANQLAADWLLDPDAVDQFIKETTPFFSKATIENFAAEQNRHPGIIVGRLQRMAAIPYQNHRKYLLKVADRLHPWIDQA